MKRILTLILFPIIIQATEIDKIIYNGREDSLEVSLNGVEVINISTPSISHSTFKEFSVSEKGAVINNAKNISRSN